MRNGKKTITMQNASCEDWTHDPWFTRPVLCHWAKEALFHLWPGLKQRWECCKQGENWPCICFYCFQERKWNKFTHHFNSAIFIRDLKIRSRQGSNLRSQRELDFKSNALTTRPRLLGLKCLRKAWSIKSLENERDHLFVLLKLFFEISMQTAGSLAEWSKALVLGTSPKGRGFESHSCQNIFYKLKSLQIIAFEIKAAMGVVVSKEKIDPVLQPNCFCCLQLRLQWRNRLAHGTYRQYKRNAGVVSSSLTWSRCFAGKVRAHCITRPNCRPSTSLWSWPKEPNRLDGLGVWFALRVREVPGSNPGWAHQKFFF